MDSLTDKNGTSVCYFLQEIKKTELEESVNVVQAQPELYGKDFEIRVSYHGQMFMKKGYKMQSIHIVNTRSLSAKPTVAPFTQKVKFKKYPRAVLNSVWRAADG